MRAACRRELRRLQKGLVDVVSQLGEVSDTIDNNNNISNLNIHTNAKRSNQRQNPTKANEVWSGDRLLNKACGRLDRGAIDELATTHGMAGRDCSDTFHEPDGTHPMHIDADVGRRNPNKQVQ